MSLAIVFAFGCLVSGIVLLGAHQEREHRKIRKRVEAARAEPPVVT